MITRDQIVKAIETMNDPKTRELAATLGMTRAKMSRTLIRLRKLGLIHPFHMGGNNYGWRPGPGEDGDLRASTRQKRMTIDGVKIGSQKLTGEIIIPANVKRTVGPSTRFDVRYQIDPSSTVAGGFSSLGVGRYME